MHTQTHFILRRNIHFHIHAYSCAYTLRVHAQNFIDTANAPIFGIDDEGRVNEWNNKAAEITGFTRTEVIGQDLVEVYITEEYRSSVKAVNTPTYVNTFDTYMDVDIRDTTEGYSSLCP